MAYFPWIVLLISMALFLYACRMLAEDAKSGYDVTMGGAMFFSHLWFAGAAAGAVGLTMLFALAWWWGIAIFLALYLAKNAAYRIIVALYLGSAAPPLPKDGFKEFIRRTEGKDKT
ncbi:MAG: hypothetical protein HY527_04435 [Betaproteobacteria bacterium]|nr:hypothetical protein [Betaproteobacteria bacterium]